MWNLGYRLGRAGDGLPIPPARLIFLVTISYEISWFLHSGRICHNCICDALRSNRIEPDSFESILDFGCGCGRVLRHWKLPQRTRIHGTDYNPALISWCSRHLGRLAEFQTNTPVPPLEYETAKFDFIYAISVFTHLPEDLQYAWIRELARVLRPAGLLLLTLHGRSRSLELEAEEQRRFKEGQLVIKAHCVAGSNEFGAYHPAQYVRDHLARGFELIDFVPAGSRDANQDIYLLRKLSR